jgi:hypothetical protein
MGNYNLPHRFMLVADKITIIRVSKELNIDMTGT